MAYDSSGCCGIEYCPVAKYPRREQLPNRYVHLSADGGNNHCQRNRNRTDICDALVLYVVVRLVRNTPARVDSLRDDGT